MSIEGIPSANDLRLALDALAAKEAVYRHLGNESDADGVGRVRSALEGVREPLEQFQALADQGYSPAEILMMLVGDLMNPQESATVEAEAEQLPNPQED